MYLEALEQRQLFSVFQISGARDAANVHAYHLSLSTDSSTIESWTLNWSDGSAPQTITGGTQEVDHTFADLTDPIITATAVDGEGVHVVALVSPNSAMGPITVTPGHTHSASISTATALYILVMPIPPIRR